MTHETTALSVIEMARNGRFAEIRDGRFDTRTRAKAAPGGAVVLVIDGFDGVAQPDAPYGRPLFVGYKVRLGLPKQPTQQTIDVPDSAAVKKAGPR